MKRTKTAFLLLTFSLVVFFPSMARADMPVGMIAISIPALRWLLLPIIMLETWIGVRRSNFKWGEASLVSISANLVSTLLGAPLSYTAEGFVVFLLAIFLGSWEIPWLLPAAILVLLIPMFFVTFWVEHLVVWFLIEEETTQKPLQNVGVFM